jgi:hypothetical protein
VFLRLCTAFLSEKITEKMLFLKFLLLEKDDLGTHRVVESDRRAFKTKGEKRRRRRKRRRTAINKFLILFLDQGAKRRLISVLRRWIWCDSKGRERRGKSVRQECERMEPLTDMHSNASQIKTDRERKRRKMPFDVCQCDYIERLF